MAGVLGPVHLQGCEKQGKSSEEFDSYLEWMFIRALPEFEFGVDVYQGSVLNSFLFIIVLE